MDALLLKKMLLIGCILGGIQGLMTLIGGTIAAFDTKRKVNLILYILVG